MDGMDGHNPYFPDQKDLTKNCFDLLNYVQLCPYNALSLKYQFWWRKLDSVILCDCFITPWMKNVQIHEILVFEFQLYKLSLIDF